MIDNFGEKMFDFKFPDVGEGITEGEIVKWRVTEGETIKQDQVIAEIETDKAVVEIPAPRAGRIAKIHHKEGDTIKVGETLVTIMDLNESAKEEVKERPSSVVGSIPETVIDITERTAASNNNVQIEPSVLIAPATRRLARELGIDVTKIKGTGLDGRITEEDVRRHATSVGTMVPEEHVGIKVTKKYDMWGPLEHIPLRGTRKAIARNMVASIYTAPHVTHMDEADVTELVKIREREKAIAEKQGIKLTYMPFVMKACLEALKQYPYLNATFDEGHEEIILKKYYSIGFATDTPDGLIVPVIKRVDQKSILDIAKEIQILAQQATDRKIDLTELKGGTFTITNVGAIGGTHATPIINQPEVAILALGQIREHVRVKDGKPTIRKIMPISLTFDHRATDGAMAARFMNVIIEHLENPSLLLIEMK